MKLINAIIIICLTSAWTVSTCQPSSTIEIRYSDYKYFVGEKSMNVVEIEIENLSTFEYVIWFDSAIVVDLNHIEKIHSYFRKSKGDFSLYNLMTEGLLSKDFPILYGSFLKCLKQDEKFIVRIIGDEEIRGRCEKFIREHFVAINKLVLQDNLQLGDESFYWYGRQSIELNIEYLNL